MTFNSGECEIWWKGLQNRMDSLFQRTIHRDDRWNPTTHKSFQRRKGSKIEGSYFMNQTESDFLNDHIHYPHKELWVWKKGWKSLCKVIHALLRGNLKDMMFVLDFSWLGLRKTLQQGKVFINFQESKMTHLINKNKSWPHFQILMVVFRKWILLLNLD